MRNHLRKGVVVTIGVLAEKGQSNTELAQSLKTQTVPILRLASRDPGMFASVVRTLRIALRNMVYLLATIS